MMCVLWPVLFLWWFPISDLSRCWPCKKFKETKLTLKLEQDDLNALRHYRKYLQYCIGLADSDRTITNFDQDHEFGDVLGSNPNRYFLNLETFLPANALEQVDYIVDHLTAVGNYEIYKLQDRWALYKETVDVNEDNANRLCFILPHNDFLNAHLWKQANATGRNPPSAPSVLIPVLYYSIAMPKYNVPAGQDDVYSEEFARKTAHTTLFVNDDWDEVFAGNPLISTVVTVLISTISNVITTVGIKDDKSSFLASFNRATKVLSAIAFWQGLFVLAMKVLSNYLFGIDFISTNFFLVPSKNFASADRYVFDTTRTYRCRQLRIVASFLENTYAKLQFDDYTGFSEGLEQDLDPSVTISCYRISLAVIRLLCRDAGKIERVKDKRSAFEKLYKRAPEWHKFVVPQTIESLVAKGDATTKILYYNRSEDTLWRRILNWVKFKICYFFYSILIIDPQFSLHAPAQEPEPEAEMQNGESVQNEKIGDRL
ncbi:hypothetical protein V1512DRAFT_268265 [Lipomyces arxii]|uniref:uncharacterized protein n=1 Tax=Lipomyces arxii TaxID=56418 RepID=UPI0034CE9985